jgi:hypothetical protein
MADAALEGLMLREEALVEEISGRAEAPDFEDFGGYEEEVADEDLLGAATLAKIREAEAAASAASSSLEEE